MEAREPRGPICRGPSDRFATAPQLPRQPLRSTGRAVSLASLLALNRVSAEGSILLADFQCCLIVCPFVPSVYCIHAIPCLNSNSLWGLAGESSYWLRSNPRDATNYHEAPASRLDGGLSLWGEFFCIIVRVLHIDLGDEIHLGLALCM